MSRSTEMLLRWGLMAWLATFAVLSGLAAGEVVKRSASPSTGSVCRFYVAKTVL